MFVYFFIYFLFFLSDAESLGFLLKFRVLVLFDYVVMFEGRCFG